MKILLLRDACQVYGLQVYGRLGWQADFLRRQPTLEELTVFNPSPDFLQTAMKLTNLRSLEIKFEREKQYEVPVLVMPALRANQVDAARLKSIISGDGVRIFSVFTRFGVDPEIRFVVSM